MLVWTPAILLAQDHRGNSEPSLNKELMELPAIQEDDVVLVYSGFIVNYNTSRLIPNWVAYELTADEAIGEVPRARGFSMDPSFTEVQAMREDYSNTGWDKGHMASAGDMKWDHNAMAESFYLTNICPQNHDLNGRDWHTLEKYVRSWAVQYGRVWVVCGPYVYSNSFGTIGDRKVVVPDGFFKAVLREDGVYGYKSIAFFFENNAKRQPVEDTVVSVNDVESLVGYDLFVNIDDTIEDKVESQAFLLDWAIKAR